MRGWALLLGLAICLTACSKAPETPQTPAQRVDAAVQRAYRFLLVAQDEDGAWRSSLYPPFRDGATLTPLVVKALLYGPSGEEGRKAAVKGVDFLAAIKVENDDMPFPVYSLSGAVIVLTREKRPADQIIAYLRAQQLTQPLGWKPEDPEYGGWGESVTPYQRPAGPQRDETRTANLSTTLFALGALRIAGAPPDDPAIQAALTYVKRCQNKDGGFFFSPSHTRQNKAGKSQEGYRSYGSTTADGLRALLRAGVPPTDPKCQRARKWILEHFDATKNSGEFPPERATMRDSLYYYYCWTTAHALIESGPRPEDNWALPLAEELLKRQHEDGSWRNRVTDMTEDEPLVATPMALSALVLARSMLK